MSIIQENENLNGIEPKSLNNKRDTANFIKNFDEEQKNSEIFEQKSKFSPKVIMFIDEEIKDKKDKYSADHLMNIDVSSSKCPECIEKQKFCNIF